jgi:hypothetical protein
MSTRAPIKRHIPWPQSPNMTAKRNGKVITEYTAGLASWYLATLPKRRGNNFEVQGKIIIIIKDQKIDYCQVNRISIREQTHMHQQFPERHL